MINLLVCEYHKNFFTVGFSLTSIHWETVSVDFHYLYSRSRIIRSACHCHIVLLGLGASEPSIRFFVIFHVGILAFLFWLLPLSDLFLPKTENDCTDYNCRQKFTYSSSYYGDLIFAVNPVDRVYWFFAYTNILYIQVFDKCI